MEGRAHRSEVRHCRSHRPGHSSSPFGTKPGRDGGPIAFDVIFAQLVQPALLDAGLEAFRADVEQRAGNIRSDMFQELLLADLVVAELSVDNPNAWYELGVRHALRARGVIGIATNGFAASNCCPESSHRVVRRSRAQPAKRVIRNALKTKQKNGDG